MVLDGPNGVNRLTQQQQYAPMEGTPQNTSIERVPIGGGAQTERPGLALENPTQAQIDAEFKNLNLGLTKEQIKTEREKLGIGTTLPAKLVFNKGLNENRTIEIHDKYAKLIFTEGYGDDPDLMNLAKQYIAELPKAARKGQERDYIAACETKLEAFRAAVRAYNLSVNQGIIENNAQARHEEAETAADMRTAQTQQVVVQAENTVITEVNKHTDESNDAQTEAINANTNRVGNSVVRRVNKHTDEVGNEVIHDVNKHTDEVGNKVIHDVNKHTDEVGSKVIHDVNEHTDEVGSKVIHDVNEHTTGEHDATRLQQQQQAVLDSKRQTIADILMNEVNELLPAMGFYTDSTVQWIGTSADRVMAAKLSFDEKKAALDELIKMVNEETVISDGDKAAFEAKYFKNTTERAHI